jgi:hypothetical protein
MPAPAPAVDQQVVWKNDEIMRFALALVRHAAELLRAGTHKFTTDIVPDTERGAGHGIAGSVITMLKNASVIEGCGVWSGPDGNRTFYAERIKSEREESKGRWIGVYQLCSLAGAEEFLRRYGSLKQPTQCELIPA